MMLNNLIEEMIKKNASCLHISAGMPPLFNIHGRLIPTLNDSLNPQEIDNIAISLMNPHQRDKFRRENSINFTWNLNQADRIRTTFFRQKGLTSGVFRPLSTSIPSFEELNLPKSLSSLAAIRQGMVIIGGSTGSGKSSTLAAILNEINHNRRAHIVTIEDPIEYFYMPDKALFSQREVGVDSVSFSKAMREAIRQDADVIMVGEMREAETISIALNAAETGIFVLASMATTDCVQTITRLINCFPPDAQHQARTQISAVLKAIVTQQLVMRADGSGRFPALEVMFSTQSIRSLIREQRFHQIYSVIESSSDAGMQTLDQSLQTLYKRKIISDLEVVTKSIKPEQVQRKIDVSVPDSIPEPNTGPGFVDVGEEIIPIEKKIIRYRANFSPGLEGAWTSSAAVVFQDPGLILSNPPGNTTNRLYVSDFNIVSKKIASFALPRKLLIRLKMELNDSFKLEEENLLSVKLFTQPEPARPAAFNKVNLSFKLDIDNKWHTLVIDIPAEAVGKMLKITMLEFPIILTKVLVSDMIFF